MTNDREPTGTENIAVLARLEERPRVDAGQALAPLRALQAGVLVDEVEAALRQVKDAVAGRDALFLANIRNGVIDELTRLGVRAPANWADSALGGLSRFPTQEAESEVAYPDPAPWPDQVDGALLLERIESLYSRHLALPKHTIHALVLWTLAAHATRSFDIAPLLAIVSPTERCGKTTTITLLSSLVPRPMMTSNITSAALFRSVDRFNPTLLVDEADSFLSLSDELRGVLNAGHWRPMARVIRLVGEDHEPRSFNVFGPKAVAAIGTLPRTLEDRAIPVQLRRRAPTERVDRLRLDQLSQAEPLRSQAWRWAIDNEELLRKADPEMPDLGSDRAADNWRPLLAVADLAGGIWPVCGRAAAQAVTTGVVNTDENDVSTLIFDIKAIFDENGKDRLGSKTIIEALGAMEERPWAEFRREKPITSPQLAKLLKPFGVRPRSIRTDERKTQKGYLLVDFRDVFARYLVGSDGAQAAPTTTEEGSNSEGQSLLESEEAAIDEPGADSAEIRPSEGEENFELEVPRDDEEQFDL